MSFDEELAKTQLSEFKKKLRECLDTLKGNVLNKAAMTILKKKVRKAVAWYFEVHFDKIADPIIRKISDTEYVVESPAIEGVPASKMPLQLIRITLKEGEKSGDVTL